MLLKVILANVNAPTPPPPPPPPLPPAQNSQQVSFAEKEDARGWFTRDSGWDDSGADAGRVGLQDSKARPVIDPNTGDVDFGASLKSSWNIFGRGGAAEKGRNGVEENGQREWEAERMKERMEREAEEKRRCDEADAMRVREITSKAVSAILLGLLKWFRVSRRSPPPGCE